MTIYESEPSGISSDEEKNKYEGFFDLIYGVIFEPAITFRGLAEKPPILKTLLIFSIAQILSMLFFVLGGIYSDGHMISGLPGTVSLAKAVLFGVAFGGFIFSYVKWFIYSGILFFISELLGGSGKAVGALSATGLASVPAMLLAPIQLLLILIGNHWWTYLLAGILMLVTWIWFIILLVIGFRETQHLEGGKSLAVVFIPIAAVVVLAVLLLIAVSAVLMPIIMFLQKMGGLGL